MYIAAGQGHTTPGDKMLMSTETSCHFGHLLHVSKKKTLKSDFIRFFFIILYMYKASGKRLTTSWDRNFNVNRNILSLRSFVASLKKISLKSDFIPFFFFFFFSFFIHVYSRRSGADNHRGQNFDVNRNLLSLCSFATSFKKFSLKSDFIQFFMILYMCIAPWQGLTTRWGRNFNVNRNILSLQSFVAGFKKISLKSDFIQFFHDFIHVYSPRAGADSPQGTKF